MYSMNHQTQYLVSENKSLYFKNFPFIFVSKGYNFTLQGPAMIIM